MNILHFSNADIRGGAAQATYQLHSLLREAGHRSVLAVRRKDSADPDVLRIGAKTLWDSTWSERFERGRARLAGGYKVKAVPFRNFNFNLAPIPDLRSTLNAMPRPDIIFIHWVNELLTAADIRRLWQQTTCPLVWMLMDLEPIAGGCHYQGSCTRYQKECHDCPQLQQNGPKDWAWRNWHEKRRQLSDLPITVLAPTRWAGDRLAQSGLFGKHHTAQIPLPIPSTMHPLDRELARKVLSLPPGKKIIFVGSHNLKDPRKGMDRLVHAARLMASKKDSDGKAALRQEDVLFLLMGQNCRALAAELPFPSRDMGYVHSEIELALAYQAANVFACPSMEDAGPMMVSQAMLCGTPVAAFDMGIAPELITSGENGYIAKLGDAEDLAYGLEFLLADDGTAGRRAAERAAHHHNPLLITKAYNELLTDLIQRSGNPNLP